MRLYAFLAEHESPRSAHDILTGVTGYLDSAALDGSALRKLRRDFDLLRSLGLDIELAEHAARDEDGEPVDGYRLRSSAYVARRLDLSPQQLAVLGIAASLARSAPDAAPSESALAAIQKLIAAPADLPAYPVSVSFRPLPDATAPGVLTRRINRLAQLIERRHPARFRHRKHTGAESQREIEPYGIGERMGLWYLVGRDTDSGDIRTFRLSRIAGHIAEVTPNAGPRYRIPDDFRISEHIVPPWQIGRWPQTVTLEFSPRVVHVAAAFLGDAPMVLVDDGWHRCELEVRSVSNLVRWMLTFGQLAEVIAPDAARAEYESVREEMVVRHG